MKKYYTLSSHAINNAHIGYGSEINKRNVATSRMAKMLGISDIIAESSMAKNKVNGKEMTGIRMEDAMCDLLSKEERSFLIDRIENIQKAIRKMYKNYSQRIIETGESWESVRNELLKRDEYTFKHCTYIDENMLKKN
ncbi:MAG: hypothetical protein K6F00_06220 [Lachnospiraceae bacterium]|nr:hypothetical protein [Lachnospiraceae bacterium]